MSNFYSYNKSICLCKQTNNISNNISKIISNLKIIKSMRFNIIMLFKSKNTTKYY